MLRPTGHGPSGTLLDYGAFLFRAEVTDIGQDLRDSKGRSSTPSSSERSVTFESAIKVAVAFATSSAITHIPCAVYSCSTATEKDSKRAKVGSTE